MNYKFSSLIAILFAVLFSIGNLHAQTIGMHWPKFAGKTYDFIIFQGDKTITAQQGFIPTDGKFELKIPKEYTPYTGMSRWLITNSKEGGGLDMAIPGKGFSVSCNEEQPNENNIVFTGYDPVNELNKIANEQQGIIDKYTTMSKAAQLYGKESKLYSVFEAEKKVQERAYQDFRQKLKNNDNYAARFLPIVNLTRGIAPQLTDDYELTGKSIAQYMANEMDMDDLYTSGHWTGLISSWVQLQTNVIKDDKLLVSDFEKIGNRIKSPTKYTDFVDKVTYYLNLYGKDKQVELLAPIVTKSGKITEYKGVLSTYKSIRVGDKAPDLFFTLEVGDEKNYRHQTIQLPSSDLSDKYSLIIFYQSGCGPCENTMNMLKSNYELLQKKGIRFISISADTDEQIFKNTANSYPWNDKFCDLQGLRGVNFQNYAVMGTPTMFLLDKSGKIMAKMATVEKLMMWYKSLGK